ncbi:hypothetical protein IAT40_004340 [Kwoniella sp. CBS 6097]
MMSIPPPFASCDLKHARPFSCHTPASGWDHLDDPRIIHSPVEYSLIFVVDRDKNKVLLGLKRRGMGVNLYNGFGGKPEKSETMRQCAARELEEEAGIIPRPGGLIYKGLMYSARPQSTKKPDDVTKVMIKIHFFACVAWSGVPQMSEEMIPRWFDVGSAARSKGKDEDDSALPIDQMWPEATFYLEPVLQSICQGRDEELFLARITYEMLSRSDAPTHLPALDGLTIRTGTLTKHVSEHDHKAERLGAWWMCLAPRSNSLDSITANMA